MTKSPTKTPGRAGSTAHGGEAGKGAGGAPRQLADGVHIPATEAAGSAAAPSEPKPAGAPAVEGGPAAEGAAGINRTPEPRGLVRIRSSREGYRRAGLVHSKRPIEHVADTISEDQLALLVNDPVLTVQLVHPNQQVFTLKQWPPSEADQAAMKAIAEKEPPAAA